jgi:hypothetical protein
VKAELSRQILGFSNLYLRNQCGIGESIRVHSKCTCACCSQSAESADHWHSPSAISIGKESIGLFFVQMLPPGWSGRLKISARVLGELISASETASAFNAPTMRRSRLTPNPSFTCTDSFHSPAIFLAVSQLSCYSAFAFRHLRHLCLSVTIGK